MIHPEVNIELPNSIGRTIYCTLTQPTQRLTQRQTQRLTQRLTQRPTVCLIHGFKGFRNWAFFPFAAQHLADAGFNVVRIDVSMNGMNGTNDRVVDLDAFSHNTPTREIEDLHEVVNALSTHEAFVALRESWDGTVHFVGHSRGGGAIQVVGRERTAAGDTTSKYVMWNSIGHWERWTPRQREHWLAVGTIEVENTRTGQKLPLSTSMLDDIEQHAERLHIPTAAASIADRALYIHAGGDLTVPIKEIEQLRSNAGTAGPLIIIDGSTHSFGMSHPIDHVTTSFANVLHHTVTFLAS